MRSEIKVTTDTVEAWPQDRCRRSPTLEQGPKGALGPWGAKIARVPWPGPPGLISKNGFPGMVAFWAGLQKWLPLNSSLWAYRWAHGSHQPNGQITNILRRDIPEVYKGSAMMSKRGNLTVSMIDQPQPC